MAMTIISMHSVSRARAADQSLQLIALFCCLGLVATLCLASFGVDLSAAGWV
jgi:hypothetical protein